MRVRASSCDPRLLEVAHVAHRLGACQEFVRRLIRDGKLPAFLFGKRYRVDPVDLDAFIAAARTTTAGRIR